MTNYRVMLLNPNIFKEEEVWKRNVSLHELFFLSTSGILMPFRREEWNMSQSPFISRLSWFSSEALILLFIQVVSRNGSSQVLKSRLHGSLGIEMEIHENSFLLKSLTDNVTFSVCWTWRVCRRHQKFWKDYRFHTWNSQPRQMSRVWVLEITIGIFSVFDIFIHQKNVRWINTDWLEDFEHLLNLNGDCVRSSSLIQVRQKLSLPGIYISFASKVWWWWEFMFNKPDARYKSLKELGIKLLF
jgi:hypothetical protein